MGKHDKDVRELIAEVLRHGWTEVTGKRYYKFRCPCGQHKKTCISHRAIRTVRTGITSLADALVSASVVLTAAIICAGAASADPSQQDQFVALLEQDQIPLIDNLPALVARAHQICGELDGGASVETVVTEEMNGMFEENPAYHQVSDRVRRTAVRFIAVSADVYCPSHLTDPLVGGVGFSILGPVSGVRHQT